MKNIKAQLWFTDFILGMLIFTFMLIGYYAYSANISKLESTTADDLISDAESISSSLLLGGSPDDWDETNVQIIGITNNNQRINKSKFNEFMKIDYNKSKKLFGSVYNYILFFVNESDDVQNIEGFCGTGFDLVNISYDLTSAYYYKAPGDDDEFLFDFMTTTFNADVFTEDGTEANVVGDYEALGDNLNNYGFVVLEAPEWSVGQLNTVRAEFENWVDGGGFLMISGELVSGNKKPLVGADFEKIAGLSSPDERATIVKEDEFFDWDVGDSLSFVQAFHAVFPSTPPDPLAQNFKNISNFNASDIEFEDILDNDVAISRWEYGLGKVFFFSDFDATYFQGDFQNVLETSTKKWIGAKCLPINITGVKRKNLVKIERLLIYNSEPIRMVLYLWQ
jgi:hypothetical protein